MAKSDKKQRNEAKRKDKRQDTRRRESVSPIKRLTAAKGEVECWASDGLDLAGQMTLFVYKQAAGLGGVACFLVDRGVVGLKDAWADVPISRVDFKDMLDRCREDGIQVRRVTPETVRHWVAGGIRWAHDNGMRLPKEMDKSVALIGGVGDWAAADVSAFVMEFAGHPDDLRQRLIGEPLKTYLRRTDIDFQFSEEAAYMDQETGDYIHPAGSFDDDEEDLAAIAADVPVAEMNRMAERFTPAATALAADTADWLAGGNDPASPELFEAWRSMLLAAMFARTAMPDAAAEDVADFSLDLLMDLPRRIESARVDEYERAVEQALDHLEIDPMLMQKAVLEYGLAGDAEEI